MTRKLKWKLEDEHEKGVALRLFVNNEKAKWYLELTYEEMYELATFLFSELQDRNFAYYPKDSK